VVHQELRRGAECDDDSPFEGAPPCEFREGPVLWFASFKANQDLRRLRVLGRGFEAEFLGSHLRSLNARLDLLKRYIARHVR
jgi:hypothetical protein